MKIEKHSIVLKKISCPPPQESETKLQETPRKIKIRTMTSKRDAASIRSVSQREPPLKRREAPVDKEQGYAIYFLGNDETGKPTYLQSLYLEYVQRLVCGRGTSDAYYLTTGGALKRWGYSHSEGGWDSEDEKNRS